MNSEPLVVAVLAELGALDVPSTADQRAQRDQWIARLQRAKQQLDALLEAPGEPAASAEGERSLTSRVEMLREEVAARGHQLVALTEALDQQRAQVAALGQHADRLAGSIREAEGQIQQVSRALSMADGSDARAEMPLGAERAAGPDGSAREQAAARRQRPSAAEDPQQVRHEIELLLQEHPDLARLHQELETRLSRHPGLIARGTTNAELESSIDAARARQRRERERIAGLALPLSHALSEHRGQNERQRWLEGELAGRKCMLEAGRFASRRIREHVEALARQLEHQREEPRIADDLSLQAERLRWLDGEIDGRRRFTSIMQTWTTRVSAQIARSELELEQTSAAVEAGAARP